MQPLVVLKPKLCYVRTPIVQATSTCSPLSCSTVALCKLLQHGLNADDKRLQDIVVKGEEIYSPDDGIRTRSKSAKSKPIKPGALVVGEALQVGASCYPYLFMFVLCRPREVDQYPFVGKDL